MPIRINRPALLHSCVWTVLLALLSVSASADLSWDPAHGWNVEGGALAGLTGADGVKALALMNGARRDEESGSRLWASRAYEKVASKYPTSVYAPEALYRAGMLRMARRQYFKSFGDLQQLLATYPNTKRFDEVVGEEYHIAELLLDGGRNHMLGLIPGFTARDVGVGYFQTVAGNAPYSDYAPLALMNVARGQQYLGNRDEAIDAMDEMINTYPQSVLIPDAYLLLAQLHAADSDGPAYDQASTKEAITYFQDFMILYPNDPNIDAAIRGLDRMKDMLGQSKLLIGDFYFLKRDNYTAARVFYNEAITDYPDSPIARLARKRLDAVDAKAGRLPLAQPEAPAPKKRFWFF